MQILLAYLAGQNYGQGHQYRCDAIESAAREEHLVTRLYGDDEDRLWRWIRLGAAGHDWLILDVDVAVPRDTLKFIKDSGVKIALIDGYGRAEDGDLADLIWHWQDPKNVILRQEVVEAAENSRFADAHPRWFVFGGSTDPLHLTTKFLDWCREPAYILRTELCKDLYEPKEKVRGQVFKMVEGLNIIQYMADARKACVHQGMIVWELAAFGIPQYVFSSTEHHLQDALQMEKFGLVKAWPEIGTPKGQAAKEFISTNFTPSGTRPDGRGAYRLLETIYRANA